MKIGVDIRSLMAPNLSGVGFYTLNLLKSLLAMDQENEYILFYSSSRKAEVPKLDYPNVTYKKFKFSNRFLILSNYLFKWPKFDSLIGGCDVFFLPNWNFSAFTASCRKVITIHDSSFLIYPKFFTTWTWVWHKMVIQTGILRGADTIIADSDNTKNDLINLLNIPAEKIKVIHLGATDDFKILQVEDNRLNLVKDKYSLPNKFILYLGTLEPRKNVEGLIEAFKKSNLPDYHLVIAGGSGWKSDKVFELAQGNDNIKFIGYVEDRPALYNLASLVVYPSFYEGFGLPLLETMACGTAVIAGANSSQGEVVGDAGLLVDPHNINEMARAMEIILKDDELKNNLINQGKERAEKFTWQKTAEKVLEIFQKK